MRKIRVLVVDDSTVIRQILSESLATDPMIEIAGTAANGKIALTKLAKLNPDIITLDMEMPEMDGLATLTELRKAFPRLPVIMFSTPTQRGAHATLESLARGANDYVTKPANFGSVTAAIQSIQDELILKIKMFCGARGRLRSVTAPAMGANRLAVGLFKEPVARKVSPTIDAVVIGTSTGGPNALAAVLPRIPANFPVPILVVQHMPPIFTTQLANRLDHLSPLRVVEATDGDSIAPGGVWLAPGNFHMTMRRSGTQLLVCLNQNMPENSCRPAVDVLFRSAAQVLGGNVLAVVMTGMGQDGQRGSEAIRDAGGRVIVQDEATSVVWGMPGSVAHAGFAEQLVPLNRIADEIIKLTHSGNHDRSLTNIGS